MSCSDECISRDQEAVYRTVVDRFVEWCRLNHLQLNIPEEKELVVDFRRQRTNLNLVSISGTEMDLVSVFTQETRVFQYLQKHVPNVLPLCVVQCLLLCCSVS